MPSINSGFAKLSRPFDSTGEFEEGKGGLKKGFASVESAPIDSNQANENGI